MNKLQNVLLRLWLILIAITFVSYFAISFLLYQNALSKGSEGGDLNIVRFILLEPLSDGDTPIFNGCGRVPEHMVGIMEPRSCFDLPENSSNPIVQHYFNWIFIISLVISIAIIPVSVLMIIIQAIMLPSSENT